MKRFVIGIALGSLVGLVVLYFALPMLREAHEQRRIEEFTALTTELKSLAEGLSEMDEPGSIGFPSSSLDYQGFTLAIDYDFYRSNDGSLEKAGNLSLSFVSDSSRLQVTQANRDYVPTVASSRLEVFRADIERIFGEFGMKIIWHDSE